MKVLTVSTIGGLGNRMRALASVAELSYSLPCPVRIAWTITDDFNAAFTQLFFPFESEFITIDDGLFRDLPSCKDNLWIPTLLRKKYYDFQTSDYVVDKYPSIPELMKEYDRVFLALCYSVKEYSRDTLGKIFRPKEELQMEIDTITSQFDDKTVGVHIRRKDNKEAIENSPLTLFVKRLDEMIEKGEVSKIFLTTDDKMVKSHLMKQYGERIITRNIRYDRDSQRGIQDAVVDMWCLAHTSHILGSYYSSFSDTASELYGAELEVIKK